MYEIEKVGSESAAILSKLWQDTFIQAYSDVHTPENIKAYCADNFSIDRAVSELNDGRVLCKIAKMNGVAVGFYCLKRHDCPISLDGSSTELKQIYSLSDHYGKGLGKTLYKDAIKTIKRDGCLYVWLCVSDINERAKAFYNKLAFEAVGTGPIFNVGSDRLTSTIMTRGL